MSENESGANGLDGAKGLDPITPQDVTRGLQPVTPTTLVPRGTGAETAGIQPILPTDIVKPPTDGGTDKE